MTDAYKVGYGRPPKPSQFKKGQSGNPLGSSRKVRKRKRRQSLSLDDYVLENAEKLLRLREGDRTSSISTKEALLKKQIAMGLNGNRLALQASLKRIEEAEQNRLAKVLENYETVLDYKDNYPARVKYHKESGLPPPLPHPDDVRFNRCTGDITLAGPRNQEELTTLKKILEARRVFLKMLEEHRLDAKECAREGYPYSASELEMISPVVKHLRSFDDELERRDWSPQVAGEQAA